MSETKIIDLRQFSQEHDPAAGSDHAQENSGQQKELYLPEEFKRLGEIFSAVDRGEAVSFDAVDQQNPAVLDAAATAAERLLGGERGKEYADYFLYLSSAIREGKDMTREAESTLARLGTEVRGRMVEGTLSERTEQLGKRVFQEQDMNDTASEIALALDSGALLSFNQSAEYLNDEAFVQKLLESVPSSYQEVTKVLQEQRRNGRFIDLLNRALEIDNKRAAREQRNREEERRLSDVAAARRVIDTIPDTTDRSAA